MLIYLVVFFTLFCLIFYKLALISLSPISNATDCNKKRFKKILGQVSTRV